jgi:hypothetical protein
MSEEGGEGGKPGEGLLGVAYKVLAESAEKTSDRRLESNNVFLAINGGVGGLDIFLIEHGVRELLVIPMVFGALSCVLWAVTLHYYRGLGTAKYHLLALFEKTHGIRGYSHEWDVFKERNIFGKLGLSLSWMELTIALAVLVGHIAIYVTFGLHAADFPITSGKP